MEDGAPPGAKFDRRIEAEPIEIDGRRIQPIARIVGWEMDGGPESGPFMSRVGRLTPVEVRIDSGGTRQEVISIEDPLQEPLRDIMKVCAMLSAACMLIMLAIQIGSRRR